MEPQFLPWAEQVVGVQEVWVHWPATQAWPAAHTVAQEPQWFTSVKRLISQPLAELASQSAKPALQV